MTPDIDSLANFVFPLFKGHRLPKRLRKRNGFPRRTINELVGVQPMTAPTGNLYSLNWRYPTASETARDSLEREIRRRSPAPRVGFSGQEWQITEEEYRTLSFEPHKLIAEQERMGGELYFYYDMGFLSGSSGAFLLKDGEIIASDIWVRA